MMRLSRVRAPQVFLVFVLLGILCLIAPAAVARADAQAQSSQCSGYYYTVKLGDTWTNIGRRVGQPVSALKSANPQAVRPRDVIYAGERLCIPSQTAGPEPTGVAPTRVAPGGYWYQVKPGDTWNKVSRATGVPVQQLWAANPGLVNRRQWLYIGQRVWIPAPPKGTTGGSITPTPLPPPTATQTTVVLQPVASPTEIAPTATASATPLPVPTSTATAVPPEPPPPGPTVVIPAASATAIAPATGPATATPTAPPPASPTPAGPTPTRPTDCPATLSGYADGVAGYLNRSGVTADTVEAWLKACGAVSQEAEGVTLAPITGPNASDAIVALHDPAPGIAGPKGQLLVYHKGARDVYALAHKFEGQGRVGLVEAADVNADGKFDLVYRDTACGAHTCFGTLYVDSWDGRAYQDWIMETPTIAEPEYTVKNAATEGQGSEIVMHGGVIGSVGAGPQRPWTETYISSKGAPYVLFSQVYDPSTCLYHKILDANRAFDQWALDGFDPAIEAYKAAIADQAAEPCGTIKDEVATLRDFARFRLLVADVAAGNATGALPLASQITNPALKGAATAFLRSYETNSSVIQACRDTTKYAQQTPASWQFLADWGYANPSFTPGDLCPLS